ncbi:hypothetical protein GCM10008111_08050 [Alishewanella tabrizica]|uniref:Uncharacterized protein n=2 Tax=Alishewanella tabrizica TaxID=671278 RepID=A0ABQ2WIR7_9ALTE|nr:hypothetical protein GCM10008111_08050 [Alishewanella tabrizica]
MARIIGRFRNGAIVIIRISLKPTPTAQKATETHILTTKAHAYSSIKAILWLNTIINKSLLPYVVPYTVDIPLARVKPYQS